MFQILRSFLPIILLGFCCSLIGSSDGTISPAFSEFLRKNYGNRTEQQIARRDLGDFGSFGGEMSRRKAKKRPVIFVHGLTMMAGSLTTVWKQFIHEGGYQKSELYGTTYSDGTRNWVRDCIECRHVKIIRMLLQTVLKFTSSDQVDVIGYSMGSPTARKAILGGHCVDTGEYLGPPLTNSVNTFIGVAGANRGAMPLCRNPGVLKSGPCNDLNGIKCRSRFFDDINANNSYGYEAKSKIYVIRSAADEIVGDRDCDGRLVSTVQGQHGEIVFKYYTHFMAMLSTGKQQLQLLGNNI